MTWVSVSLTKRLDFHHHVFRLHDKPKSELRPSILFSLCTRHCMVLGFLEHRYMETVWRERRLWQNQPDAWGPTYEIRSAYRII
jgi:hypothetical protein